MLLAMTLATAQDLKLWYAKPATQWTEALPVGNSHMGAMVYGGVEDEELQLNEETFWAGGPHNNLNPKGREALGEIRKLVFADKFKEAQNKIDENFNTPQNGMRYLTLGSMRLKFNHASPLTPHPSPQNYSRSLNLADATAKVNYTVGDVNLRQASHRQFRSLLATTVQRSCSLLSASKDSSSPCAATVWTKKA